jgi:hypothetical protein
MATVVTNNGKGVITARFLASAPALSLYVGWGTGNGTAAAADTALFTEAAEARAAAAVTQATTTAMNDTIQAVGTLTATASRSVTNAGLVDAATSGNLIMKGDFSALPLNTGDSIAFTMEIQFT